MRGTGGRRRSRDAAVLWDNGLRRNGPATRKRPGPWTTTVRGGVIMAKRTCSVPSCERPTLGRMEWCSAHYHRQWSSGDVRADIPVRSQRGNHPDNFTIDRQGYARKSLRGHPVANAGGVVRMHRMVLYDALGPGWHPCHVCGKQVHWSFSFPHPLALTVDHLNQVKLDNRRENLAPCCNVCNPRDGARRMRAAQRLPDAVPRPDCILWTREVTRAGYGVENSGGRKARRRGYAHRLAWVRQYGPIPDGYEVDHLCRVKRCVNLEHLQVLSKRDHRSVTRLRESRHGAHAPMSRATG